MGGSSPSGTTTTTTNNTPFNASQILDYQNRAIDLANNNPYQYYGGQTFAGTNPNSQTAAGNLANLGLNAGAAIAPAIPGAQSGALSSNANLATGGGVKSALPSIANLNALATNNPTAAGANALNPVANGTYLNGASPYYTGLQNLATGTAANDLTKTANGAFLGQNPYLTAQFNAAADPVTRAFANITAPQTDSQFESAGRFSSGALGNARSVNQQNLGNSLDNLAASIYGTDYQNERGLMNNAASSLGSLQTNALTAGGGLYGNAVNTLSNAATNMGQLGALGQNSQTAAGSAGLANYTNLLNSQQNAINATPALTGQGATDYNTALTAGNTLQGQSQAAINDLMARFYGNQQAPWQTAQSEAGLIGSAIPGMSSTSTPYFSNPLGSALGAAGSVASAAPLLLGK